MNYSDIGGIPVITETNVSEMIASTTGKDTGRGRRERNYDLEPVGSLPYASAAKRPVYSREVLIEMIRDKQRRGRFIHKMALGAGVKVDHQGTTNFCWVQATKKAVEKVKADVPDTSDREAVESGFPKEPVPKEE